MRKATPLLAVSALALSLVPAAGRAQGAREIVTSMTANSGLYGNAIADIVLPTRATEVCIVAGGVSSDQHEAGDDTAGGNCQPGDTGWIIERDERPATTWDQARLACLRDGMRLPEPFEFQLSCRRATELGLLDMVGNFEWVSNSVWQQGTSDPADVSGLAVATLAESSCENATWDWIGRSDPSGAQAHEFRCVR